MQTAENGAGEQAPRKPRHVKPAQSSAEVLIEVDAAAYIAMSVAFLRKCRTDGGGPRYTQLGRAIRYRLKDLETWLETRTRGAA